MPMPIIPGSMLSFLKAFTSEALLVDQETNYLAGQKIPLQEDYFMRQTVGKLAQRLEEHLIVWTDQE